MGTFKTRNSIPCRTPCTVTNKLKTLVPHIFMRCLQLLVAFGEFVLVAMATEDIFETSTASLLTALDAAISSKRFQVISRFSSFSFPFISSAWNLAKHSSKSAWSASINIFLTFSVKLWTAWFQWLRVLFSKAGKIIGSMIFRFCVIRVLIWSLFHKNNVRSATYKRKPMHGNKKLLCTCKGTR